MGSRVERQHVRLNFYKQPEALHIGDDLLARFVAIEPRVFARLFVHRAVVVHHADHAQIVAKPHFEVVGVVRGRNFYRARAEFGVDVFVRDNGNFSIG